MDNKGLFASLSALIAKLFGGGFGGGFGNGNNEQSNKDIQLNAIMDLSKTMSEHAQVAGASGDRVGAYLNSNISIALKEIANAKNKDISESDLQKTIVKAIDEAIKENDKKPISVEALKDYVSSDPKVLNEKVRESLESFRKAMDDAGIKNGDLRQELTGFVSEMVKDVGSKLQKVPESHNDKEKADDPKQPGTENNNEQSGHETKKPETNNTQPDGPSL